MSFRRHPALLLLSALPLLFSAHALAQDAPPPPQPESVLPSTLVENIHLQHHLFPDKTRQDIVKPLAGMARTTSLSREEEFYLAEFKFLALNAPSAHDAFAPLAGGKDWIGRFATERLMLIESRAFDDPDKVAATMDNYRKWYKADPSDIMGMYWGYAYLAGRLTAAGDHAGVVDLVERAVSEVDYRAPYAALALPRIYFASFKAQGKEARAIELMTKASANVGKLKSAKAAAIANAADDPNIFENAWRAKWFYKAPTPLLRDRQVDDFVIKASAFLECVRKSENQDCT